MREREEVLRAAGIRPAASAAPRPDFEPVRLPWYARVIAWVWR